MDPFLTATFIKPALSSADKLNSKRHICIPQVIAAWQWLNCYENRVPPDKTVLAIYMDEIAVRTYATPPKGLVSLSPKARRCRQIDGFVHPAGRKQHRAA